jgi:hypothetical protein
MGTSSEMNVSISLKKGHKKNFGALAQHHPSTRCYLPANPSGMRPGMRLILCVFFGVFPNIALV